MSLYLRSIPGLVGTALVGTAAYALYKTGAWRPVAVGTIRAGMKVSDWTADKYRRARREWDQLRQEAKADSARNSAVAQEKDATAPDKATPASA
jgi:hypothetical protein